MLCHTLAYWWLPEGLLRGRSLGALAVGDEAGSSWGIEWLRIVAFNVVVLLLFYVAANLIRLSNGVPLGYQTVIVMQAYFGIVTGTSSCTLTSAEGKIAPSFFWLLTPGFDELSAYAPATAATYESSRWQDVRVRGRTQAVRLGSVGGRRLSPAARACLAVAVAMLVATGGWEAHDIMGL